MDFVYTLLDIGPIPLLLVFVVGFLIFKGLGFGKGKGNNGGGSNNNSTPPQNPPSPPAS